MGSCSRAGQITGHYWNDCTAIDGCVFGGPQEGCYDRCAKNHSGGEAECLNMHGCGWKDNKCFAANSRRFSMAKSPETCTDVAGWYDRDGPDYTCSWYASNPSFCKDHGANFRNFGYTAKEACCACKYTRRELGEWTPIEVEPKIGFLHHGGLLHGISRTVDGDTVQISPIDSELVGAPEESCVEWNWWDAETHTDGQLLCPEGQAIGTLYQSGIEAVTGIKTYNLENGYCCHAPVTIDCVWKTVADVVLGEVTCDRNILSLLVSD